MINRTKKLRQDVQRLLREDYRQRLEQMDILPDRIATERARLTSIRSASAESEMIRGGGNVRLERDTAILVEIDRLSAELQTARMEVRTIEKILSTLTSTERHILELMDLNRQAGALDRICQDLNFEKSKVYDLYDTALDKVAKLYWGTK